MHPQGRPGRVDGMSETAGTVTAAERRDRQSGPRPARLVGLDLARGLAVFGMFAAHLGPDPETGGPVGAAMGLAHGRASALFAVLAGCSLVLLAGRRPGTGRDARRSAARIAVRAVLLIALGAALDALDPPISLILTAYGAYFLLALPLLRLPAGVLAGLAAAWALLAPQLSYALRTAGAADLLPQRLAEPLLTGAYPAATWMPFVLAGMALARLDPSGPAVRRRAAAVGAGLLALGYGGSWLAVRLLGAAVPQEGSGAVDPGDAAGLLGAAPHTGTSFEVLGALGFALLLVAGCLELTARPAGRTGPAATGAGAAVAAAVAAVARLSLTAYVAHVLVVVLLGIRLDPGPPLPLFTAFVAGTLVAAGLWTARFARGPLEAVMHRATGVARLVP
ncbi:heparan-alpha-glucosaminide N-acetyltransferase domain-containing protein [Kitasatospora arboriphila]|uniref:Heparan-alpha-glucosaminide N-acetyltransferase domain-containing protein n=2 Tax=Kitasatospora arboriphila TaxID=258052 RepID=A0ABN1TEM0_9ACTN